MNDLPRQKLRELSATYGRELCDDPRRCRALLSDHCPGNRREISVLIGAQEEGVPADVLRGTAGLPWEALRSRLTRRLVDARGLSEETARWAVETWGLALGAAVVDRSAARVDNAERLHANGSEHTAREPSHGQPTTGADPLTTGREISRVISKHGKGQ